MIIQSVYIDNQGDIRIDLSETITYVFNDAKDNWSWFYAPISFLPHLQKIIDKYGTTEIDGLLFCNHNIGV